MKYFLILLILSAVIFAFKVLSDSFKTEDSDKDDKSYLV